MSYLQIFRRKINFKVFGTVRFPKSIICLTHLKRDFSRDVSMINETANRIEIKIPRWHRSLNFSYVWLRDHCRCNMCYNPNTFQRIIDVSTIPLNIRPTYVSNNDKELHIQWPDGHFSKFDFQFLWENTLEGKQTSKNVIKPITWNKSTFPLYDQIKVSYDMFKNNESGQRKLCEAILTFGIGVVDQVPPTVEATREAVEEICPVRRTFFGEMWAFESNLEKADSAYSDEYLGCHTDTTYFSEASRIQVFHCLKPASEGGENLFVDGFKVGEQLLKKDPKCYEYLSKTAFPCEYTGDNQDHKSIDTIFKHHPVTKKLVQFRFNVYDRAPLSTIPFHEVHNYYKYLQTVSEIVRDKMKEVEILLKPGQVAFIDNWRVMHGRKAYKGPRIMGGCYIENSDFTSKARILGLKFD